MPESQEVVIKYFHDNCGGFDEHKTLTNAISMGAIVIEIGLATEAKPFNL